VTHPEPIAIFYQSAAAPSVGQTKKPMKEGGYTDSGADIGFGLWERQLPLITPISSPSAVVERDWVFPDNAEGFEQAYQQGARCFWLNTVLYKAHPVTAWLGRDVSMIGQIPEAVEIVDDKFSTNASLREAGLCVASSQLISLDKPFLVSAFPVVLKPVRGRGSQGVSIVHSAEELSHRLRLLTEAQLYGSDFICEELLPGTEITITVMPPGHFVMNGVEAEQRDYWSLPPVERFQHQDGIAPYNGVVAVTANSSVMRQEQLDDPAIIHIRRECERAAALVNAKGLIRIDCRQDIAGKYHIFDLNMKPNMTGAGRPGREQQDSLVAIAARAIGWSYTDLLVGMVATRWRK
jgi:D-alanine-D-alanine ligase